LGDDADALVAANLSALYRLRKPTPLVDSLLEKVCPIDNFDV
jgi:hypothetical protein